MQQISGFLKKFSGFINSKQQSKKIAAQEIARILGVEIKKEFIEIRDGVLYIKESPIIKNTIFYNKKDTRESTKNRLKGQ